MLVFYLHALAVDDGIAVLVEVGLSVAVPIDTPVDTLHYSPVLGTEELCTSWNGDINAVMLGPLTSGRMLAHPERRGHFHI